MLLGLAILLLNVCEDHIASTCYLVNPEGGGGALKPWLSRVVGTDEVQGCACCLAKTKGISDCFMEVRETREEWPGLLWLFWRETAGPSVRYSSRRRLHWVQHW
jgi:hypothetical protein